MNKKTCLILDLELNGGGGSASVINPETFNHAADGDDTSGGSALAQAPSVDPETLAQIAALEGDGALAHAVAFAEGEDTSGDAALAHALADALGTSERHPVMFLPREDFETIQRIAGEMQSQSQDADVHAFNKAFAVKNRDAILGVCEKLGLVKTHSFDMMQAFLKEFLFVESFTNLIPAVDKFNTHVQSSGAVDGETGLNTVEAFSMVSDLLQKLYLETERYDAAREQAMLLATSISEGLNTAGGCYPGYAGRLFRDLVRLLAAAVGPIDDLA